MTTIEKSVDVGVPVRTAYDQWTQFESFPQFMEGVDRVVQVEDTLTHWETTIGGVHRQFDAEITEEHPDERVAWHTVTGPEHGGVVTFHRIDEATTRVSLQMEYQPETVTEKAGAMLGIVGNRVHGDLQRFKEFIEDKGTATGGWRGDVDAPAYTATPQDRTEREIQDPENTPGFYSHTVFPGPLGQEPPRDVPRIEEP